jgi:hypothetical protein
MSWYQLSSRIWESRVWYPLQALLPLSVISTSLEQMEFGLWFGTKASKPFEKKRKSAFINIVALPHRFLVSVGICSFARAMLPTSNVNDVPLNLGTSDFLKSESPSAYGIQFCQTRRDHRRSRFEIARRPLRKAVEFWSWMLLRYRAFGDGRVILGVQKILAKTIGCFVFGFKIPGLLPDAALAFSQSA